MTKRQTAMLDGAALLRIELFQARRRPGTDFLARITEDRARTESQFLFCSQWALGAGRFPASTGLWELGRFPALVLRTFP